MSANSHLYRWTSFIGVVLGWLAMGGLHSCAVAETESGAASVAVAAAGNSITAL